MRYIDTLKDFKKDKNYDLLAQISYCYRPMLMHIAKPVCIFLFCLIFELDFFKEPNVIFRNC